MCSWNDLVNPYTKLVRTKPGRIVELEGRQLSAEGRATFDRLRAAHPRLLVELGSGSGGHLIELARRTPDALCLGFELRYKRAYRTIEKAERAGIENVMVLRADATTIGDLVEAETVDGCYVNFPDPWDKRRWLKKRLLNPDFLKVIHRLLRPGAVFAYKTDHRPYFDEVLERIRSEGSFALRAWTHHLYEHGEPPANIATEFEQLFVSQGLPINQLLAEKLGSIQ
jgi:tRNA (guanine-N7-)-methyltransferase